MAWYKEQLTWNRRTEIQAMSTLLASQPENFEKKRLHEDQPEIEFGYIQSKSNRNDRLFFHSVSSSHFVG